MLGGERAVSESEGGLAVQLGRGAMESSFGSDSDGDSFWVAQLMEGGRATTPEESSSSAVLMDGAESDDEGDDDGPQSPAASFLAKKRRDLELLSQPDGDGGADGGGADGGGVSGGGAGGVGGGAQPLDSVTLAAEAELELLRAAVEKTQLERDLADDDDDDDDGDYGCGGGSGSGGNDDGGSAAAGEERPSSAISNADTVSTQLSIGTDWSDLDSLTGFELGSFDLGGFDLAGGPIDARYGDRMESSSCSSSESQSLQQAEQFARDGVATPPLSLLVPSAAKAAYSTLASTGALEIPFDELTLHELLDSGAGAQVFRAEYKGVEVAVKRFHRQDSFAHDPKALQKVADELKNEVAALHAIQSPRVLRVHGVCIEPPNISIVMQYAHKGCLHKVLHRDPHPVGGPRSGDGSFKANASPSEVGKLLRMLLDCAEGMSAIHAKGMVHRDLKTHNLLVDQGDRVIVGDLGMTRRLEENTGQTLTDEQSDTVDGGAGGTMAYMAPEVMRAEKASASGTVLADVYSFGVCCWELFSGLEPWAGRTACQIALEVGKGRSVMAVHGKPVGMPSGVAQLCHQCLQPDPADRLDFSAIVERLRSLLAPFAAKGSALGTASRLGVGLGTPAETANFWGGVLKSRAKRGEFVPPHVRRHIEHKLKEANKAKKKAANRPPALGLVLPEVEEAEQSPAGPGSAAPLTSDEPDRCRTCGGSVDPGAGNASSITITMPGHPSSGRSICESCEMRLAALSGVEGLLTGGGGGGVTGGRQKAKVNTSGLSVAGPLLAERRFAGSVLNSTTGSISSPRNQKAQQQAQQAPQQQQQQQQQGAELGTAAAAISGGTGPRQASPKRASARPQVGAELLDQLIASAVNVQAARSSGTHGFTTAPKSAAVRGATPRSSAPGAGSSKEKPGTATEKTRGKSKAKDASAVAATAAQSKESVAELAASMVTNFVGLQPNLGLQRDRAYMDEGDGRQQQQQQQSQPQQPMAFTHWTQPAACRVGSGIEDNRNTASPPLPEAGAVGLQLACSSSSFESAELMSSESSMEESPRVGAPA